MRWRALPCRRALITGRRGSCEGAVGGLLSCVDEKCVVEVADLRWRLQRHVHQPCQQSWGLL